MTLMTPLRWTKGYKYKVAEDFRAELPMFIGFDVSGDYGQVRLSKNGILTIKAGWPWDGASGPTWDTKNSMRASLVHDALYMLMRQKHLPLHFKTISDEFLRDIGIQDGMWKWRARKWFKAVQAFALDSAIVLKRIFTFPKEKNPWLK